MNEIDNDAFAKAFWKVPIPFVFCPLHHLPTNGQQMYLGYYLRSILAPPKINKARNQSKFSKLNL